MEFENNLSFTDYSLESINISYTNIEIIIELENRYKIECENFISIDYIGQWDENIIDNIFVTSEDELIDLAKRKIQKNNNIDLKGGGSRDFYGKWLCLIIKLIDSVEIKIVCSRVKIFDACSNIY